MDIPNRSYLLPGPVKAYVPRKGLSAVKYYSDSVFNPHIFGNASLSQKFTSSFLNSNRDSRIPN